MHVLIFTLSFAIKKMTKQDGTESQRVAFKVIESCSGNKQSCTLVPVTAMEGTH